MASVMPVRALIGVAALTAALGLSLVAPVTANAAPVRGTTVAPASTVDPTLTRTMKVSRAARAALPYAVWLKSPHGHAIFYRESKGTCGVTSYNGLWRGKWQMTMGLWKGNGGLAFAKTPEKATCAQQDLVAHHVWVAAGWSPWGG